MGKGLIDIPREPRCRRVSCEPKVNFYKPQGISRGDLQEVILKVEELEAIRLKDLLRLEQEECAQRMQVSRPTFQRVLTDARYKIAEALTNAKAIRIEGGDYCLGGGFCRRHGRYLMGNEQCARWQEDLVFNKSKETENTSKKIAICSTGTAPSSPIDERFGRCACFMIWDPDTNKYEVLPNTGPEAARGAGTGAVQVLLQKNVGIVIVPKIGRKAHASLKKAGIKVLAGGDGKTVEEVRQSYQAGEMQELLSPND